MMLETLWGVWDPPFRDFFVFFDSISWQRTPPRLTTLLTLQTSWKQPKLTDNYSETTTSHVNRHLQGFS